MCMDDKYFNILFQYFRDTQTFNVFDITSVVEISQSDKLYDSPFLSTILHFHSFSLLDVLEVSALYLVVINLFV